MTSPQMKMSESVSQEVLPPLLRLPTELHRRILGHLISSTGTTEPIIPVLYTCKQLYHVALPLSVYKFQKRGPHSDDDEARRAHVVKFLRYITITKPELAQQVKVVVAENWPPAVWQAPLGPLGPTEDEMEVYRALIYKNIGPNEGEGDEDEVTREELICDVERGSSDALYALLMIACTGLKEIYLAEPLLASHFQFVLGAATTPLAAPVGDLKAGDDPPLSQLRKVYHEGNNPAAGYLEWDNDAVPLFKLPSLRSYECVCARVEAGSKFLYVEPRSSTVEHICFRNSRIASSVIHYIAGACKSLRSFEYTRGVPRSAFDELMPLELMNALLQHANTLESLYLNVDEDDISNKRGWEDNPEILCLGHQLKEMVALKTLVTGMQPLTGMLDDDVPNIGPDDAWPRPNVIEGAPRLVECLPENLERLEVFCCGRLILDQAQELLDLVSLGERFRRLRHVRFLFNMERIDWNSVKLNCSLPSVRLEVVFQTRNNRNFDLAPGCPRNPDSVSTICSGIQAPHLGYREQWLKYRGTDQALLSDKGRIIVTEDLTLSIPLDKL